MVNDIELDTTIIDLCLDNNQCPESYDQLIDEVIRTYSLDKQRDKNMIKRLIIEKYNLRGQTSLIQQITNIASIFVNAIALYMMYIKIILLGTHENFDVLFNSQYSDYITYKIANNIGYTYSYVTSSFVGKLLKNTFVAILIILISILVVYFAVSLGTIRYNKDIGWEKSILLTVLGFLKIIVSVFKLPFNVIKEILDVYTPMIRLFKNGDLRGLQNFLDDRQYSTIIKLLVNAGFYSVELNRFVIDKTLETLYQTKYVLFKEGKIGVRDILTSIVNVSLIIKIFYAIFPNIKNIIISLLYPPVSSKPDIKNTNIPIINEKKRSTNDKKSNQNNVPVFENNSPVVENNQFTNQNNVPVVENNFSENQKYQFTNQDVEFTNEYYPPIVENNQNKYYPIFENNQNKNYPIVENNQNKNYFENYFENNFNNGKINSSSMIPDYYEKGGN